jgi:hypothetical protein
MISVWKKLAEKGRFEDKEKAIITENFTFWKTKGTAKSRHYKKPTGKGLTSCQAHGPSAWGGSSEDTERNRVKGHSLSVECTGRAKSGH